MASRQLRKLRKQQELLTSQNESFDKKEESSEEEEVVAKPRPNMFSFAALGEMGDGDDEEEEDEDEEDDPEPPKSAQKEAVKLRSEPAKKKSKKKKKKKGKQSGDTPTAAPAKPKEDEIEKALKELNIKNEKQRQAGSSSAVHSSPDDQLNDLLKVDYRHLKAANEMRRLFGKAMDLAQVEENQENRQRTLAENIDLETYLSATAANPRRGQPTKPGMFETLLRTNPFIEGKKSWPRGAAQGLIMKRLSEGTPDVVEFAFAHEKFYDDLEKTFFHLVQMGDPMQIIHFLHRNPYHVSSLIQGSKVARQDQNSALAADLIERALFTFGRVTLSDFRRKLEQGKARIGFARPENRQFYLAGYNLIQKLILKGTYRTALEWAKLFLSLDHADPYGFLNWIPMLALRSRESEWFIKFCDSVRSSHALGTNTYPLHALPLAHLQLDDCGTALEILINNIEANPWLYCSLFSALNLDTPPSIWGLTPRDDDERLHIELHIHTCKDLWNNPNAISLLKSAAEKAKKTPKTELRMLAASPSVELSTARWIYLDNTPSLMGLVPRMMLHNAEPNFEFDPLPPAEEDNIFSSPVQRLPWSPDAAGDPSGTNIDPRREAGMRAAAERMLADMPREQLERLLHGDDAAGGGLMGLWNALMARVGPAGNAGARGAGAGEGQPQEQRDRGPFQATVEEGDDDGDDYSDEGYDIDWNDDTPGHALYNDDEDDGEWTDPEDPMGFDRVFSIAEALELMRMTTDMPMPGAWVPDEDLEDDEEMFGLEEPEEDDGQMPVLESPEEADRNPGQAQSGSGGQPSQGTAQPPPS